MNSPGQRARSIVNYATFILFAVAGVVAAVAGTVTDVSWIKSNIPAILLFEISTLLAYLVLELGAISRRVSAIAGQSARVAAHESSQPLYRAAAAAINESLQRGQSKKSVWIVSATGIPETLPSPPDDPTTKDYYNALTSVMRNPSWSIRILYNVDTLDRLDWIHDYLSSIEGRPDLEARALTHVDQEILAPLIVGEQYVLIAQGDRRYHAVRAGIEIVDGSANDLMRSYFDSLWHDVDLVIRRPTGIDEAAFEKVRSELRSRREKPS